jgi:aminomethyltransferase
MRPAAKLTFMKVGRFTVAGAPAIVSRSGYTGEDGFEISLEAKDADRVARALLAEPEVLADRSGRAGFAAARSGALSLRPRHGRDHRSRSRPISPGPSASAASWTRIFRPPKRSWASCWTARRKRVGIRPDGKAPARDGTEIADKTGRVIGKITSGGFGPSLNAPVAMGYVESAFAADGTKSI